MDQERVNSVGRKAIKRKSYTKAFKQDLISQSFAAGASVSAIARANGINANQLFAWRKNALLERSHAMLPTLLPVQITDFETACTVPASSPVSPSSGHVPNGRLEIIFAHATLRVHGDVDATLLRAALQQLAQ